MLARIDHFFRNDESGAISSLYAIAILPLVVMAGVAFDYGRMMGLDTELQNAADQAALAAATQLDGSDGARANAITAATNALGNQTRFANDGTGRTVTIAGDPENPDAADDGFGFYQTYEADQFGDEATGDGDARVVDVTVEDRAVRYALTPVMAAFSGGVARGRAAAKLLEATCNVPPLMFCQPNLPGTSDVDNTFPDDNDVGKGLALHFKSQNLKDCPPGNGPKKEGCAEEGTNNDESTWAPGNFGFLDMDYGISPGNQNQTTGLNSDFLGCTAEPPETEPGFRTPQGSALNSRLDVFPPPRVQCDGSGNFCPSTNTRKNMVLEVNNVNCTLPGGNGQGQGGGPTRDFVPPPIPSMDAGYPRDTCFGTGACQVVGNNNDDWGSAAFMAANHTVGINDVPDLDGNGRRTRYEVYKWEQGDPATRLRPRYLGEYGGKKYCSFPRPVNATPGLAPSDTQKDRRLLTVAAVDCSRTADDPDRALAGRSQPYIVKWVDLFLVQAVNTTGSERFFFTEVKGPARLAGDKSAFQKLSRRKAVLIR